VDALVRVLDAVIALVELPLQTLDPAGSKRGAGNSESDQQLTTTKANPKQKY
jgi:hypothetical protein